MESKPTKETNFVEVADPFMQRPQKPTLCLHAFEDCSSCYFLNKKMPTYSFHSVLQRSLFFTSNKSPTSWCFAVANLGNLPTESCKEGYQSTLHKSYTIITAALPLP